MSGADTSSGYPLDGRVAVVTGGASGIGEAIARRFAACGAHVAILDVGDASGVVSGIAWAGRSATFHRCDVRSQRDVDLVFTELQTSRGQVDILVNSAGVAHVGTVETTSEEDFDRVCAINVKGVYNCLRAGVRAMRPRGRGVILNIASVASTVGIPDRFAYSMSKGAVLTMTYSVARDYVSDGIRCNAIAPGRVHTPFVDGFLAKSYPGREAEMFNTLSRTQPIGRMGRPDEIAELALFLCSDAASFITGTNVAIDGGFVSLKM